MIPSEERMGTKVTGSCCNLLRDGEIKDNDYKDSLTRCEAMQSGRCVLTMQRNLLHSLS
jgi:hypothetical protein